MIDARPLTRAELQRMRGYTLNITTTDLIDALILVHDVYDAVNAAREHARTYAGDTYEEIEVWMSKHRELNEVAKFKRLQVEITLGVTLKELP